MSSVPMKLHIKMPEMGLDFSVDFSFAEHLQGTLLNFLPLSGEFIYLFIT